MNGILLEIAQHECTKHVSTIVFTIKLNGVEVEKYIGSVHKVKYRF